MGEARRRHLELEQAGIRLPDGFTGLLITTPCYSGVSEHYAQSLALTAALLAKLDIPNTIVMVPGEAEIHRARNNLLAFFMASKNSHMLCIDADVKWKAEDVVRLLLCGHEFVMGVYPRKKLPEPGEPMGYPIAWKLPAADGRLETCPKCGAVEINGGPAGFLMIRRSVGEKMAAAYPELKYDGEKAQAEVAEHLYGFYNPLVENRVMWAEDLSFCKRWRACGGSIWLAPQVELDHAGHYVFRGSVKELLVTVDKAGAKSGAA